MEENTQTDNKCKPSPLCFVKMLVNNLVAGSVIGKNGSIINSIENKTGCSLKLSPNNSYFPNTQERVLVLCGKQEQINNALLIILDKIRQISSQHLQDKQKVNNNNNNNNLNNNNNNLNNNNNNLNNNNNINNNNNNNNTSSNDSNNSNTTVNTSANNNNNNNVPKYTCRIVVPKSSVSAIIGKGGQQIKQLQDSTGTKIQISGREDGLNERIISIVGPFESITDTALKVTNAIQNDPNLKDLLSVIYHKTNNTNNNRTMSHNFINHVPLSDYVVPHPYNVFQQDPYVDVNMMNSIMRQSRDSFNLPCEISIQIPDELTGSVIGKNGSRLTNIMNTTGAQIRISRKGELIPGTTDRKVRIMGTVAAVHAAHVLLLQRLESVYMNMRSITS
ncbi:RNA-binding protein Nova-1, putative [Hepatocystis sp. ex Piliocolobus tephrosceles]|nr:RNA-binding protein Nova-1, putative [Hepatocystis sp. ex Piliocolobus tephrosceles]